LTVIQRNKFLLLPDRTPPDAASTVGRGTKITNEGRIALARVSQMLF